jgi:hypothetical protein
MPMLGNEQANTWHESVTEFDSCLHQANKVRQDELQFVSREEIAVTAKEDELVQSEVALKVGESHAAAFI